MSTFRTVSLEDSTYARLCQYRARLELAVLQSPRVFPTWLQNSRLSLDDAVAFLLDQQEAHSRRTNKAKGKARGEPQDEDVSANGRGGPCGTVGAPGE